MELRTVHYFLIVANEGNITKAANRIHITQPTLSRQLMQLEEELGITLFERGKNNIILTDAGVVFRRRAQELVNLSEKVKNEVRQTDEELTGEISIGCSETQSIQELSDWISDFRKTHPLVSFEIRSANNIEIDDWLERGLVDLGLLLEPANVEKYRYLRMERKDVWGVLVHKDSRLAGNRMIRNTDLIGTPLITTANETMHNELASWCREYAQMMVPMVHYNLLSNAAAMVRKDENAAVCAKPGYVYDELVFIPFEPRLELGAYIVWKDSQVFSKATTAFIRHVETYKNCMDQPRN